VLLGHKRFAFIDIDVLILNELRDDCINNWVDLFNLTKN